MVPWPISERAMRITTRSFGWITIHALISGEPSWARTTCFPNGSNPRARPPVTAAELTMNERRFIFMVGPLCLRRCLGGGVNRGAHFLERAAAADVGHRSVDVCVGRLGLRREQRRGGHDHPGLAVAALRHLVRDPGLLHLVQRLAGGESFDGGDFLADH